MGSPSLRSDPITARPSSSPRPSGVLLPFLGTLSAPASLLCTFMSVMGPRTQSSATCFSCWCPRAASPGTCVAPSSLQLHPASHSAELGGRGVGLVAAELEGRGQGCRGRMGQAVGPPGGFQQLHWPDVAGWRGRPVGRRPAWESPETRWQSEAWAGLWGQIFKTRD